MAYQRVTSSSPFSDGSSTDGTVIVNAIEAGLETVETALGVTNPGSNLKYWAAKTANYTLTATDTVCSFTFTAAAGGTATIPSAVTMGAGKWFTIKNSSVPTTTATTVTTVAPLGKLVNVLTTGTASSGQATFTLAVSSTPVYAGMWVCGSLGIPVGAVVQSYNSGTGVVTLNCNLTGSIGSGTQLGFAVPAIQTSTTTFTPSAVSVVGNAITYTIGTHSVTAGQTVAVQGDTTNVSNNGVYFVSSVVANTSVTLLNPGAVSGSLTGVQLYAGGSTAGGVSFKVLKNHPITVGHYIMAVGNTGQGPKVSTIDTGSSAVFDTITLTAGSVTNAGWNSIVPESRELTVASATNIVQGSTITTAPTGITAGTTVAYITGTTIVLGAAINGTLTAANTTFTNDTPPLSVTSATAIDGQTTISMPGNGYLSMVSDGSVWKVINGQYVNELAGRRIARWDQIAASGSGAWQTVFYDSGSRSIEPATAGSGYFRFIRKSGFVNIDTVNYWMGNNYPGGQGFPVYAPIPYGGFNYDSFGGYRESTSTGTIGQCRSQGGPYVISIFNPLTTSRNNQYGLVITGQGDPTLYPPHLPGIPSIAIQA